MKILLSVFECSPAKGSDSYVGWSYATHLAEVHEVYALTRSDNREEIEEYYRNHPELDREKLHFIYLDRSRFFSKFLYRINRYFGFLGSYWVWQCKAYRAARRLCRREDIAACHHVSIADVRVVGHLWKLDPPFFFGPVGGGQETPPCLAPYVRGHEGSERFRACMNRLLTALPGYRRALRRAAGVYCSNDETLALVRKRMRPEDQEKAQVLTELGMEQAYLAQRECLEHSAESRPVHVMISGRLMYRKGIALLLDAVEQIHTEVPFVVDICGEGVQQEELIGLAQRKGLDRVVQFHGKIEFSEMQHRYKTADIYVLPSLRESTGTAVFEAMANKLPVVALCQNGVRHVVGHWAGILVDVTSHRQIVSDLAQAITTLIEQPELRLRLGQAGFEHIRQKYTWEKRVEYMSELYQTHIR